MPRTTLKECGAKVSGTFTGWDRSILPDAFHMSHVMTVPTSEAAPSTSHMRLSKHRAKDRTERRVQPDDIIKMLFSSFPKKEHILIRNQNLVGLKLPDLSEAAEQEKGRWGRGRCSSQVSAGFIFARLKKVNV